MLLEGKRKHAKPHSEGSWAVSYVDMLTLLLCFFIVFYNSNASNPNSKVDIHQLFLGKAGTGAGGGDATAAGRKPASSGADVIQGVATRLPAMNAVVSQQDEKSIELVFKDTSFFEPGSVVLTEKGSAAVKQLLEVLEPERHRIHVTVRGHTDTSSVSAKRTKYSDNWELSVLRATQVLKIFLNQQYDQSALSAEGVASTQVEALDKAYQRRVTFKIEVRT